MWRGRKKRYSDDESDEGEEEVVNRKSQNIQVKKTAKLKELQQSQTAESSSQQQQGSMSTLPISILGSSSTEGATLATVTYVDGQPTVTSTPIEQYTATSGEGAGEISVTVQPVTVDGQQVCRSCSLNRGV